MNDEELMARITRVRTTNYQDTRLASLHGGLVWCRVAPTEDSSMTLLPDPWGPFVGCPTCEGAWSHVQRLGVMRDTVVGRILGLHSDPGRASLWVEIAVAQRACCARIACVAGHAGVVYHDGVVEPYLPLAEVRAESWGSWRNIAELAATAIGMRGERGAHG